MTQDELNKLKAELSEKRNNMTQEERNAHDKKITEDFFNLIGKDRIFPTDNPNIWKIIPKKVVNKSVVNNTN